MAELVVRGVKFTSDNPIICVPVVKKSLSEVLTEVSLCVQMKVPMIELRADFWDLSDPDDVVKGLSIIRKAAESAILLFTIRSQKEGGESSCSTELLRKLYRAIAATDYVDIVDIEYYSLSIADSMIPELQKSGKVVIGSYHNFKSTPAVSELVDRLRDIQLGGADIVKVAVMPSKAADVAKLLEATAKYVDFEDSVPAITMSMGSLGVVSRISGATFGSCVTFATIHEQSAPGQLSVDKVKSIMAQMRE